MTAQPVCLIVGAGDALGGSIAKRYALKERDDILNPERIAENDRMPHKQLRDAWTYEIDVRPRIETW